MKISLRLTFGCWEMATVSVIRSSTFVKCLRASIRIEFESNSLETLMRIVDVEGGFTLIPELALQYMSPEKKKQVRSIANTKPLREVSVIYSRHFTKQRLITLLCDEIKSVVPAHMLKRDRGMIVEWKVEKNE